jgi:hypothetical protein
MKNIIYISAFLTLALIFGCKKDNGSVQIDSVYKNGSEFFQKQKVQVWVGAQVNDLSSTTYTWECDGGSFSGPTGLFQTVWVAPIKQGEYNVSCTVECNGVSEKRSTKMVVGQYFFDKFGVASTNFTLSNFTATYANGEVLLVGSKSATRGSFRREFGDTALLNPFTYKADMAWRVKYKGATSSMYYRLQMNKPLRYDGTKVKQYIREVRLELWPTATGTTNNYALSFETFNSEFSLSTWTTILTGRNTAFVFTDGSKASDLKGMRTISIGVNSDFKTTVSMDGTNILESDALKTWRTTNSIPDKMNLGRVWVEVFEQSNFYLDNIMLSLE